jgi:hypothetical protein
LRRRRRLEGCVGEGALDAYPADPPGVLHGPRDGAPDARRTGDDAGWLAWDVPHLGALLSPYKSVRVRERLIERAGDELVKASRLVIHPCGCALIPRLEVHQRIGGNKSFTVRDRHLVHTRSDKSARNVTVGNGMERNVAPEGGSLKDRVGWVAPGKPS